MTILTAMLLLLGVGAIVTGGDNSLFSGSGSYQPKPDQFTLRAGRVQSLDVLLNDTNSEKIDPATLQVTRQPQCGTAMAVNGAVQYSDSSSCRGALDLAYCVPYDDNCEVVKISLNILNIDDNGNQDRLVTRERPSNDPNAPVIVDLIVQGQAPEEAPQIAMARPMRLSLPNASDVITPREATEDIRRLNEESAGPVVTAANRSDSAVTVSNTSARAGRVAIEGATMAAPEISGEGSGIAVAAASDAAPDRGPRGAAPTALASASPSVTSPQPGFIRPERPMPTATPAIAAETAPMKAPAADEGDASPATLVASAPNSPQVARPMALSGQEVALAPDAQTTEPGSAAAPRVPTGESTRPIASLQLPAGERSAPGVDAPAGTVEVGAVDAAPADRIAMPGTPDAPRDESAPDETRLAAITPEAPGGPVLNPQSPPSRPSEVEAVGRAPEAQVAEPTVLAAPVPRHDEDSGVLASLARSNTVLGATVSAAKALFGPEKSAPTVSASIAGNSAPRPIGVSDVQQLGRVSIDVGTGPGDTGLVGPKTVRPPSVDKTPTVVAALDRGDTAFVLKPQPATQPPVAVESDAALDEEITPAPAETEPEVEIASLPPAIGLENGATLGLPDIGGSSSGAADLCEVDFSLQVQVGAELVATLSSPCRPDTSFLVEHAGLAFTAETDADGFANFVVPAMETNAVVRVGFPDGAVAVGRHAVESLNRMTRVAVVWSDPVDFDLYAREFGAAPGSDDEIWSGNPRNYRLARRSGGGYLTNLGPESGEGVRAEVYTIFQSLRTKEGEIDFGLSLAEDSAACDRPPVIRVVRSAGTELDPALTLQLERSVCAGAEVLTRHVGLDPVVTASSR
ncbi:hypothetical protein [Oceanibium sediminis]|uniref:hypothetical protein n=1 Tax=Oceanibium sediminis TaxID=2026339 RepID=UPI0013009B5B|nr:hypothetical protein [Oceanibium sediminis]